MSTSGRVAGTKGVPRADRERQILAGAVDEFAARGYAGASMIAIAARAQISKPLVYQYFGSKDGLYLACLHAVGDALLDGADDAERAVDDTVASRIHPLRAIFEALEPRRQAWLLLHDPSAPVDGEIGATLDGFRTRLHALATSGSVRFLQARGLRDGLDAAALGAVWTGVVDALVTWWLEHPEESASAMVARCGRLLAALAG